MPGPGAPDRRGRARVIGAVTQVSGQHDLGLGPGCDVRPSDPLALVVPGHAALLAAVDLHIGGVQVDRDRPPASAAARPAGSIPSIRPVTTASPASTACHCAGVIRRASPAAVVDASPGTGVICWPAASARWRSSPARKSSPASCAAAIPHSSSPAPRPRSRCLTGPTAASSAPITPSRSHNSLITARPACAVSDASGAPARTR